MEIKEFATMIIQFRDDRNWKQFHALKDLLIGLDIEIAELGELFLWKSAAEIEQVPKDKIANEIADIFIFLNYIAHHFQIDIESAVLNKIRINNEKYPVDKSYGSNKKYDQL